MAARTRTDEGDDGAESKPPAKSGTGQPPARVTIAAVFEALGGVEKMVSWVESDADHRTAFYSRIYPRLIPLPVPDDPEPMQEGLKIEFV